MLMNYLNGSGQGHVVQEYLVIFVRFVKYEPYQCDKLLTSVSALVSDLGWQSLQSCRLDHRLSML